MAEPNYLFTDGEAYERFMGRWSTSVGAIFLDWVKPKIGQKWLDAGCGTGVFSALVLDTCAPSSLTAIDPSQDQIAYAWTKPISKQVDFRVADAQSLPFGDNEFDVVASALVINFIADRPKALAEMCRVTRAGGLVAGYVWDFAGGASPASPLGRALRHVGSEAPQVPGASDSTLDAMTGLFTKAGFADIEARAIEVTVDFPSFDILWTSLAPGYSPAGKLVAALSEIDLRRVKDEVSNQLLYGSNGNISFLSRAHAVKARAP